MPKQLATPSSMQALAPAPPKPHLPLLDGHPRSKEAIGAIRAFLESRGCLDGHILLHRTSEAAFRSIMESGFDTRISFYLSIESTVTVLDGPDDPYFGLMLELRHRASTHHALLYAPPAALKDLEAAMEGFPSLKGCKPTLGKFAYSIGGTIPREWILGAFLPEGSVFIPAPSFDPSHIAELKDIQKLANLLDPRNLSSGYPPDLAHF